MTSTPGTATGPRTYGGWRLARGIGLFGLGPQGTVAVLACVLAPMLAASLSLRAGALFIAPAAVVAAAVLTRVRGQSLAQVLVRRVHWSTGQRRGWTVYRRTPRASRTLPGLLAATAMVPESAEAGTPAFVWNRRNGLLTVTLRCAATSTWAGSRWRPMICPRRMCVPRSSAMAPG